MNEETHNILIAIVTILLSFTASWITYLFQGIKIATAVFICSIAVIMVIIFIVFEIGDEDDTKA